MPRACRLLLPLLLGLVAAIPVPVPAAEPAPPIRVLLLLGTNRGHHGPQLVEPFLAALGDKEIKVETTNRLDDLNAEKLKAFDVLAIFRDNGELSGEQESALVQFVESGKGFVPIHCASHPFRKSDAYTKLVGGRFLRHGYGPFGTTVIDAQHPAMKGFKGFTVTDETYVSDNLAKDNQVLMVRDEAGGYEPSSWARTQGQGRVFYTALGHDEKTWGQPEFHDLLVRGMRWAAGRLNDDAPKPEVVDGKPGPLSPADSMKHMHLPEGFRVELFASEPDVVKPIAMTWDARGRLWVLESLDYPNDVRPLGATGRDRVKICEDTDGDGKADKFTIFAEGLNIPTSLLVTGAGMIVNVAPDIVLLQDTDGDDRADARKVLVTGFGRQDTHAVHANLHYGHDNWIYASVGYSGGEVTAGGKTSRFRQGFFRFKPDGSAFEFLTGTTNNTWGLGFNSDGDLFGSTANNGHAVEVGMPNRAIESVAGWLERGSAGIEDHKEFHSLAKVRQVDWFGQYTAAAGFEPYTAGALPEAYRERAAFVCEPTGHLVHIDWLVPQGSGFVAKDGFNLLASTDEWTAPIVAQAGPDGAVWTIDWYNYIVRHNPTPPGFKTGAGNAYVTPERDQTHGRIYRIVHESQPKADSPKLDAAKPDTLLAALGHDNLWWRLTAQRMLVERGQKDVVPALAKLAADPKAGRAAAHALRVLEGLDAADRDAAIAALKHPEAAARRAALATLPTDAGAVGAIVGSGVLGDADPRVRRDALLALAERPGTEAAAKAVAALLNDPANAADRWIARAAIVAAAREPGAFLAGAAALKPTDATRPALVAASRTIAEHLARRGGDVGPALAALATADPAVTRATLAGLAAAQAADRAPADADALVAQLKALFDAADLPAKLDVVTLARRWGRADAFDAALGSLRDGLLARLADEAQPEPARLEAARQYVDLGGAIVPGLLDPITPRVSPAFASGLLDALGRSTAPGLPERLLERWGAFTPAARRSALSALLARPERTTALLDALDAGKIDAGSLPLDAQQRLLRHPDAKLAARAKAALAKTGGLPSPDRQKVLTALLPLTERHGDATRGKKVFEDNCAKCHRYGSLGADIGPDLTGSAASDKHEILTNVIDPNRSVEGNYRQYTVATADGRVLNGLLAAETETAIELLDSEAKRQVVLRQDIEEMKASESSLMPEGFEKLAEADLADLLEFLAAKGRFVPLPLGKAATYASTRGMFYDANNPGERIVLPSWGAVATQGVPFQLVDPKGDATPNVVLLYGPTGDVTRTMPRSVSIPCKLPAKAIHLLGGVAGWASPGGQDGSVSMIVRLHYADGTTEDHPLRNGKEIADYIRVVDVPGSKLAFTARGRQQVRYLAITPARRDRIETIELVKGPDRTAPLVMGLTIEQPDEASAGR
jgi:putative membrane-bound dehydrogenase-like protein